MNYVTLQLLCCGGTLLIGFVALYRVSMLLLYSHRSPVLGCTGIILNALLIAIATLWAISLLSEAAIRLYH